MAGPPADQVEDGQQDGCPAAATEFLYQRSGKQFTGSCGPVTIRPVFRPTNADTRGWVFAGGGGWGYGWGASAMGNVGRPPCSRSTPRR